MDQVIGFAFMAECTIGFLLAEEAGRGFDIHKKAIKLSYLRRS
jgi:hypothetical protein